MGRTALYHKKQALFKAQRAKILDELSMLEEQWNRILQSLPPDKEKAEQLIQKLNAAIVAKDHELADLDADVSKLANITQQNTKAVIVRGFDFEGSNIEINTAKYTLPTRVSRAVFKLKNNKVVMVKL